MEIIAQTAEETMRKIENPDEVILVQGKIQLLKKEGLTLLDYFNENRGNYYHLGLCQSISL